MPLRFDSDSEVDIDDSTITITAGGWVANLGYVALTWMLIRA